VRPGTSFPWLAWPLTAWRRVESAFAAASAGDGSVDGRSGDGEQFLELADGAPAGAVELDQVGFLAGAEFGLLAAQPPLGAGDGHAFSCSGSGQVRFELGDHAQGREQQPPDRVGGVVQGSADVEPHTGGGELVDDVARVGHGAGQPIELGDDEGVALSAGGQGLAQPGAVAVGAGQSVVEVDPLGVDAERGEGVLLGSEVLIDVETRQ